MRQDTATPPPGHRPDTARTAVSVAEASTRLGITHDAVRKKLQRGTLAGDKQDGEWRVFLPEQDTDRDNRQDATETRQDTARTRLVDDRDGRDDLIEQLRSENGYLRGELSKAIDQAAAERERADVLHREALNRIEALTARANDSRDEEPIVSDDPVTHPTGPGATQPVQGADTPEHHESWLSVALRRLFGKA